jgi:hypothetical protein
MKIKLNFRLFMLSVSSRYPEMLNQDAESQGTKG